MTPQELKNSILQLAIQGKLVEQRPEEGTAEELYRQIQAEKQALIKAGKLKKEKPLPEITEDEIPFEIPESWKWVHLNQIAESSLGKTLDKAKNTGELCPYLCSINVYWNGISLETVKTARFTQDDKAKYRLNRGDLLICEGGDVGRAAIWDSDDEMYYQNALHRVRFYGGVLSIYFRFVVECYKGIGILDEYSKGMTIKHLVQNSLYAMWLPFPPLAEQKRIVAKIEELLPLIDRYEKAWSRLEDFNKRFPGDMQKSILQMAIQGKLVEQRPEEGTGEELYKQIQAEKQALIKAGKIKKEKPLPEISESEAEIDIPSYWLLCKLGTITRIITDGEHKTPRRVLDYCGYFLLSARNIRDGFISLLDVDYIDKDEYEVISKRCNPKRGDVLISCSGSVGRCAVVLDDSNYAMVRSAAMVSPLLIDSFYLMYAIQSEYVQGQIRDRTKQTAQANLFQDAIRNLVIPLPPLAEQKRIVARLEELLPLCENLK